MAPTNPFLRPHAGMSWLKTLDTATEPEAKNLTMVKHLTF